MSKDVSYNLYIYEKLQGCTLCKISRKMRKTHTNTFNNIYKTVDTPEG